jgi:hypothetical protein
MSDATRDPGTAQEIKTRSQLLTRAEKNPKLALENGWYHDPAFCLGFGDWPENAFDELGAFRRSFIAPVPSGLAERIGRPDRLALSGRSGRRRG